MSFRLLHATADDVAEFCQVREEAFVGSGPLSEHCFPRTEGMRQFALTGLKMELENPSCRLLKYVDTEKNKIAGIAIWYAPTKRPDGTIYVGGPNAEEVAQIPWPSDCDGELNKEIFVNFAKHRESIMGNRPHYYLELLATRPSYRGTGAGRKLIEWGLDKADEEKVEAYIEALPKVISLYEKFGWKVISSYTNEQIKHTETFMLRPAKA